MREEYRLENLKKVKTAEYAARRKALDELALDGQDIESQIHLARTQKTLDSINKTVNTALIIVALSVGTIVIILILYIQHAIGS